MFTGKLLPTQYKFIHDFETREIAYIGGYGAGKSQSAACKAIKLAAKNPGFAGALLSPTYGMLTDTLMPTFEETLNVMKVRYDYKASPQPFYLLHFRRGTSKVFCRSAENYRRLASLNLAWAIIDEGDLIAKEECIKAWKMLQSRLRTGKLRQLCMTSTPEGYAGAYHLFVKEDKGFRKIYKAKTTENHHLPADYIENLYSSYSAKEIEAYVNGEFVNLTTGTVYDGFDREQSHTDFTVQDFVRTVGKGAKERMMKPVLHVGCDFNINQTSGIVTIVKTESGITNNYVVDEFTGLRDTEALIKALKQAYAGYDVHMYPDSSGKSANTATTATDIALLRRAFGPRNVHFHGKNPKILNRVKAVNAKFLNSTGERRLYVNTTMCPTLTTCLEQQAFDPNTGLPDKKHNLDHPLDALGYFVHYRYPLTGRPTLRNVA